MPDYESTLGYLEDLRGDPSLAVISMQMAAEVLDVSRAAIEQRVRSGSLDGLKVGKTRWVLAASVTKQLDTNKAEIYRIKRYLERLASAGESIDYGTLMSEFGMTTTVPADRKKVGWLLGQVSRETWDERGVMLSVLVMRKNSTSPGPGFFELADELDENYQDAKSDAAYVSDQVNQVLSAYGFL